MARWTVAPGRRLEFNGQLFVHLEREGNTSPTEADGAAHLIAKLFNREGVTPDTIHKGHMGKGARTREASHDRDRPISMTYGTIPPFEEFERDIRRPNPDESDGSPYWPPGTLYPMELVNSDEIECAEAFGEFEEFSGKYGKRGFRGDERQIYDFLEYLAEQDDFLSGEEGSPGDLGSSIMTTLGYEWV